MRVSQGTIAKHLGISQQAVSYALRGSHLVSDATRDRVLEAAKKLGYRVNTAAQTVRSGTFNSIALILGSHWGVAHLPSLLMSSIERSLRAESKRLVISRLSDSVLTDESYVPDILRQLSVDGLLIAYNERVPSRMVELVRELALPAVWLNAKVDGVSVYPDELWAGQRAAEVLIEHGHRHIAYSHFAWSCSDPALGHFSVKDRLLGVERGLAAAGLPLLPGPLRSPDESDSFLAAVAGIERWLRDASPRPTALVAYTAGDAMAAHAAAHRLGLRVPEDLSVIGFGDKQDYLLDRPLTYMQIPEAAMGICATETLFKLVGGESCKRHAAICHAYHDGASVTSPRQG